MVIIVIPDISILAHNLQCQVFNDFWDTFQILSFFNKNRGIRASKIFDHQIYCL